MKELKIEYSVRLKELSFEHSLMIPSPSKKRLRFIILHRKNKKDILLIQHLNRSIKVSQLDENQVSDFFLLFDA